MTETWVLIKGYERYSVSDHGRVKRNANEIEKNLLITKLRRMPEIILKVTIRKYTTPYYVVGLYVKNYYSYRRVHELVGEAFLGTRFVVHKNGDFSDNRLENLEVYHGKRKNSLHKDRGMAPYSRVSNILGI